MAEQRRPTGQTIQVDRIISVARDRETGGAVIRLKDSDGRTIALRLWNRQLRALVRGSVAWLKALDTHGFTPTSRALACTD